MPFPTSAFHGPSHLGARSSCGFHLRATPLGAPFFRSPRHTTPRQATPTPTRLTTSHRTTTLKWRFILACVCGEPRAGRLLALSTNTHQHCDDSVLSFFSLSVLILAVTCPVKMKAGVGAHTNSGTDEKSARGRISVHRTHTCNINHLMLMRQHPIVVSRALQTSLKIRNLRPLRFRPSLQTNCRVTSTTWTWDVSNSRQTASDRVRLRPPTR